MRPLNRATRAYLRTHTYLTRSGQRVLVPHLDSTSALVAHTLTQRFGRPHVINEIAYWLIDDDTLRAAEEA